MISSTLVYIIALTSSIWLLISYLITPVEISTTYYTTTQTDLLINRIQQKYNQLPETQHRLIISLAGIPGSGKSTLAQRLLVNLQPQFNTVILPMDGFHLSRKQLTSLPDPKEAFRRRGAPFTFNPQGFVDIIKKINDPEYETHTIYAPSFDHAIKDPVDGGVAIEPNVQIVIVEGNYVSLKDDVWDEIESLVHDTWFIECDLELAKQRVVKRHLQAGISQNEQEAIERVESNDLVNAQYIINNSKQTNVVIVST